MVQHASLESNLRILDELVTLFRNQEPIPGDQEFPRIRPVLDSYDFPVEAFPPQHLDDLLSSHRIQELKRAIRSMDEADSMFRYLTGSSAEQMVPRCSVDMVFSQAVLEYVKDLPETYRWMGDCLKPAGFVSHQIDFSSHGLAPQWDGHWAYSDFMWAVIRGRRVWFINRQPCSVHLNLLRQCGFRIVQTRTVQATPSPNKAAKRFSGLSSEDRTSRGAFIQAVKNS